MPPPGAAPVAACGAGLHKGVVIAGLRSAARDSYGLRATLISHLFRRVLPPPLPPGANRVAAVRARKALRVNACGHHHVGHIGILGVDKKGSEFYQISLGGHAGHSELAPSLGQIVGPSIPRAEVCDVIAKILEIYVDLRLEDESFLGCFKRVGIAPFKERVYAPSH